jgi:hypothetical protein
LHFYGPLSCDELLWPIMCDLVFAKLPVAL